jgi:DNA-binding MarR family transcriptional regulator
VAAAERETADGALPELVALIRLAVQLAKPVEGACLASGLSLAQYRLLLALERSDGRACELAARVGVQRSSLTALATGLEQAGLVSRGDVADDRRGVVLRLTPAGERALALAERAMAEALRLQAESAGAERVARTRRLVVRAFQRVAGASREGRESS